MNTRARSTRSYCLFASVRTLRTRYRNVSSNFDGGLVMQCHAEKIHYLSALHSLRHSMKRITNHIVSAHGGITTPQIYRCLTATRDGLVAL